MMIFSNDIPWFKKMLSFISPVSIGLVSGKKHDYLEILLYRNQWLLATEEAIYSNGTKYIPILYILKSISYSKVRKFRDCLILGAGLGSAVQVLHKKYGSKSRFHLVEMDAVILNMARELLGKMGIDNLKYHESEAVDFLSGKDDNQKFDLIFVDVFNGKSVPENIITQDFFKNCKNKLTPQGVWAMNYIFSTPEEWQELLKNITSIFGKNVQIIEKNLNRLIVFESQLSESSQCKKRRKS